ncbi:unnamed protein product [Litomosoides sigmodontis]|uniref:Dihydrolipoamide acetyltransferase component of pyruvate dehydrogenase complex n=1 Tax=Litomosoides sigmodontis TaxID=42156 RepID=A0A3P6TT15_LITSI|nr:unnamed protein product [Litomosoides sigmodontis]
MKGERRDRKGDWQKERRKILSSTVKERLVDTASTTVNETLLGRFFPLVQFKLSDIGEGIAEVQIKEWHVKEGDHVTQFDNICEVQSDKASVTITSRYDGVIKKLYYNVEDVAKVGTTLVDIEVADADTVTQGESLDDKVERETITSEDVREAKKVLATPAVRQIAREMGVNLNEITGTGPNGRILKDDVIRYVECQTDAPLHSTGSTLSISHSLSLEKFEVMKEDKVIPVRGYTRAMVKSMTESLKIPHLGFSDEVSFDKLITMREELKKTEQADNVRMSFMPIIIKAVSLALTKFPILNAITDKNVENIICKASHNISVAMDTPEGLVVPNIKHCEQRTVWEIAAELNRLQEAGNKMKIVAEDLKDGTFALSNVGMIGGTYLSPVIMPPQLAIGAIGQISKLPRFDKQGNICATNVVKFSWAADHRIIDGAMVARFSNQVKRYLENPSNMIADLR